MVRLVAALACVLLVLASCATPAPRPAVVLPTLHLAPAALGRVLSEQQQLRIRVGKQERDLDALLEVDPDEVRLLVQAMGQSGVRLSWDGTILHEQRAAWLPSSVRGARVLDDLQFALWPADAIRKVLPVGWTLQDDATSRELQHAGRSWLIMTRKSGGQLHLENLAEGYQLEILSGSDADDADSPP